MSKYMGYEPMEGIEMTGPQRRSEGARHLLDLPDELLLQVASFVYDLDDGRDSIRALALVSRRLSRIVKEIMSIHPYVIWTKLPAFFDAIFSTNWNPAKTQSLRLLTWDYVATNNIGDYHEPDADLFSEHALNKYQVLRAQTSLLDSLMAIEDQLGNIEPHQHVLPNRLYPDAVFKMIRNRLQRLALPHAWGIPDTWALDWRRVPINLKELKSLTALLTPLHMLIRECEYVSLPPRLETLKLTDIWKGDLEAFVGPFLEHKTATPFLKIISLQLSWSMASEERLCSHAFLKAINDIKKAGIEVWIDWSMLAFPWFDYREVMAPVTIVKDSALQMEELFKILSSNVYFQEEMHFPPVRQRARHFHLLTDPVKTRKCKERARLFFESESQKGHGRH
ncbi:hypothetical protein BU24DRAFT_458844 [Aaosphaeria arxii CBS 175.79]|uniref:F-box domain-containing protein n=1 Tax=Aaosphaeria arxii CBS 175.79 TaxID=1450172 RepID=A0A6A5Y2M2_9PLEO|nr:uncharacterized protein BU24DRAFT_458844 [Aaosphaeria arxii CBS 175.79]KAF2019141.1 hypothetical protein BU24DRAFT_458844 [Aaosphaeria arxii CBS 175.79]